MPFSRPFILLATALLCACGVSRTERPPADSPAALAAAANTPVARGRAFAEAQCSGCHAVRPGVKPPNPQAPSFVAVANDMGFDRDKLREFFRDGHETPAAMSIELDEDEAEMVAAYIMSLRAQR